jgi:hypothetical protein
MDRWRALSPTGKAGIVAGGIGFLLLCLCAGVASILEMSREAKANRQLRQELVEADQQWTAGQKAQAVAKYESIIEAKEFKSLDKADKHTAFLRTIEYEDSVGNTGAVKELTAKAKATGVWSEVAVAGAEPPRRGEQDERRVTLHRHRHGCAQTGADDHIGLVFVERGLCGAKCGSERPVREPRRPHGVAE